MHFLRHFLSDSPSSLTQPLNKAFHYAFRVTFPQGGGNYKNCYYENTTIFSFLCCTMKLGLWWKKAIGEGSVESSEIEWRAGWGKSRLANISITRLESHHVMGKKWNGYFGCVLSICILQTTGKKYRRRVTDRSRAFRYYAMKKKGKHEMHSIELSSIKRLSTARHLNGLIGFNNE